MRAVYLGSAPEDRAPIRRRTVALVAVIVIHLLLVLALLSLSRVREALPKVVEAMKVFTVLPVTSPEPSPAAPKKAAKHSDGGAAPGPKAPRTTKARTKPKSALLPDVLGVDFDLAKVPREQVADAGGAAGKTEGADTGMTYGPVQGPTTAPGGQPLYAADWYTEPTEAQLSTYLPSRGVPKDSWGMVACRTIDHYRVEDCTELEESPIGSGLARAVREAAWQFRVRPPRIGGNFQVGTWVRIRIDFTEHGIKDR